MKTTKIIAATKVLEGCTYNERQFETAMVISPVFLLGI